MRRGWILLLLAAAAGAQEFSEQDLDRAIREVSTGGINAVKTVRAWGPKAARAAPTLIAAWANEELRSRPTRGFMPEVDEALWAIGPAAVPSLRDAVKAKERSEHAVRLLRRFAREAPSVPLAADSEKRFVGLLNESEQLVRLAAARCLATSPTATPSLIAFLGDKSPRRREAAAHALAFVDPAPEGAAAALLAASSDAHPPVRDRSLIALARLRSRPEETFPVLVNALGSLNDLVVRSATWALSDRGPEIAPLLIEAWDREDAIATGAAEALACMGDAVKARVEVALRSGTPRQRRFAAVCLSRMRGMFVQDVEPPLVSALADPDAAVRLAAADGLGAVLLNVSATTYDGLLVATGDKDPTVRAAALASAALASYPDERLEDAARRLVSDADARVRAAAKLVAVGPIEAEAWGRVAEDSDAPLAVRLFAIRRVLSLPAGFAPALPSLTRVVRDETQPFDVRFQAAIALRLLLWRRVYEARGSLPAGEVRDAVDRGLRWLAKAQQKDGRWAAEAWNNHDLGVTGLAVLAFLAAGHTHKNVTGSDPYAANVCAGLDFMVSTRKEDGLLVFGPWKQHTLVEHAIATHALCETVAMTLDGELRPAAEAAVAFCVASRNPKLAWRYEPRGGKNDTHVTTWMLTALRIAEVAGFHVDPAAFEGAASWIDKMTEPNFGQVGYDYPGGQVFRTKSQDEEFPADQSYAMTAAGVWCRLLLGEDPRESDMVQKGANLCAEKRPAMTKPGGFDFYYWYYGSLVCHQVGRSHWKLWQPDLERVVLANQTADGSWDPKDAWGFAGGRAYATAILTLALLTPTRYPSPFAGERPPTPFLEAEAALRDLAGSESAVLSSLASPD